MHRLIRIIAGIYFAGWPHIVHAAEKAGGSPGDSALFYMKKVGDRQLLDFERMDKGIPETDWQNAVLYAGLVELMPIDSNKKYRSFLYDIGDGNSWNTGPHRFFADDYCIAQLYTKMYRKYRAPKMIAKWKPLADSIVAHRFDESLRVVPGINYREWAWCDALFMGPPALAYLSAALKNERYLLKADSLWWKTTDYLYDSAERLFYRDSRFFDRKEANGRKMFWSRGNGWVMAGTVRMLENMPRRFPNRERYISLFKQMAGKIIRLQQPDGSWHAALLDPAAYEERETSGTALFCYALAWGIRHGILSGREYRAPVEKAWKALVSSVHPDGTLGYVQRVGDKPTATDYDSTGAYGVGAFLLAGSEIYKLIRDDETKK
jgi:rhamnogalacturonyl hydrolase YesR